MLRASFVLLALSCAAPLLSLAEPLRFAGDDGCPYLCPGTPQRPGYLVEALSQVLREPPHFDSLPWPRAVQMVRDGHRDGLVGAYGLDGLRVGSEPIGWVEQAFYTRHDSDWRYSGDASLLGQRLGLAQGYVNNPRFEAWRSQAGDDDLHLQVLGGERVLPRNLQKLLLGRIDVLLEDRDIIEHYLEHHPQLAGQVRRAGELPGRQPLHVGLSPHLPEVDARLAELDEGLRQLRREGTLKVLGERYRLSFE
ncbi:TPA: substrate-binding periplasmic protein [Pseudomonas aeruginosa]|uniref:substrate-binding periplasmic protein n=1 Tax=Pseudomonas aeruginosa TaxID=287 RepID=UPI00053E543F|nr:ABC transporter substrate-binding protein [Pseudomonas aeruginosa]